MGLTQTCVPYTLKHLINLFLYMLLFTYGHYNTTFTYYTLALVYKIAKVTVQDNSVLVKFINGHSVDKTLCFSA